MQLPAKLIAIEMLFSRSVIPLVMLALPRAVKKCSRFILKIGQISVTLQAYIAYNLIKKNAICTN